MFVHYHTVNNIDMVIQKNPNKLLYAGNSSQDHFKILRQIVVDHHPAEATQRPLRIYTNAGQHRGLLVEYAKGKCPQCFSALTDLMTKWGKEISGKKSRASQKAQASSENKGGRKPQSKPRRKAPRKNPKAGDKVPLRTHTDE